MESKGAISSTFPEKKHEIGFFSQSKVKIKAFSSHFFSKASRCITKSWKILLFLHKREPFSNENITRSWIFSASNSIQTHNTPISLKVIQCMTKVVVQDHRVWKCQNFPATRILCEINFGECWRAKNGVFDIFKSSKAVIFEGSKFATRNSEPMYKTVITTVFEVLQSSKLISH